MKFVQKYSKLLVLAGDALTAAGWFLGEKLTDWMLLQNKPCDWAVIGAQCGTCGGTRCVNNFLNWNFIDAFMMNPYVFICGIYLLVSLLLLNLWVLFDLRFAGKALGKMYNLVTFFIALGGYVLFIILRNIPFILRLLEHFNIL